MDRVRDPESASVSIEDNRPLMSPEEWSIPTGINEKNSRVNKNRSIYSLFSYFIPALNTVLLLAILVLLLNVSKHDGTTHRETSGDYTGFFPEFGVQVKRFAPDPEFTPHDPADWFKNSVREKWLSMVPKGLGYVLVKDPEKYNDLPTPLPEYDGAVYTTSVTHQLHCLYKLEEFLSIVLSNTTEISKHIAEGWHTRHCLEYLRQSILCCGDTTLEGKQTTFPDSHLGGSDGWDATHICRDYGQIRAYLEEKRVNDKVWI